jgi:hypothetical protein
MLSFPLSITGTITFYIDLFECQGIASSGMMMDVTPASIAQTGKAGFA